MLVLDVIIRVFLEHKNGRIHILLKNIKMIKHVKSVKHCVSLKPSERLCIFDLETRTSLLCTGWFHKWLEKLHNKSKLE